VKKVLSSQYLSLRRRQKKWLMVAADVFIVPTALWAALALRLGDAWPALHINKFWWLFFILIPFAIVIFAKLGLYRAIIRYIGSKALYAIVQGSGLMALVVWSLVFLSREPGFPRSIPIIFAMVLLAFVGGSRLFVRWLFQWINANFTSKEPIAIYGAGDSGSQLVSAIQKGKEFVPVAFFDDNPQLWKLAVQGITVYQPDRLDEILNELKIKRVLLAMPCASKKERKAVLDRLEPFSVHVQTIPSMPDIVEGNASVDQVQDVELEDLLGRDPVPPKAELFDACLQNKVVLVTGAGGSIGSELCRQIIKAEPEQLILFEQNEFSLYAIDQELAKIVKAQRGSTKLIPILGSVVNSSRVNSVFEKFSIQTVYHAAAYKHVPMVEHNVFEGIRNNIIGTQVVAETAFEHKTERFVLVSTDKAVRPTNVMGATKRFAEQIVQSLASKNSMTVFSMVRFGNVLGSSGSVVPLFRSQIANGGPVTVTHSEITRYFMTIPEASQLVIQAGAMAKGGEVFVLDMGEPVKIVDLAVKMIELTGHEVKSESNPDGEVEILFTGLRPGEKLYEELLIGDAVAGTVHPKIMNANELHSNYDELQVAINELLEAEVQLCPIEAREILQRIVLGFTPSSPIVDHLVN